MKPYLLVFLILLTGCMTLDHTNCKKPEQIILTIQDRPTNKMKLSFVTEGIAIARFVGNIVLNEEAKQYEATYTSTNTFANIVVLTPIRKLDKRLILERLYKNESAAKWIIDLVPITITNSTRGYCQIQPQSVNFIMSKAKMTGFLSPILHANELDITLTITLQFASAQFQNGLSQYAHTIIIKNAKVGESISLKQFTSPIYEVASDGPLSIRIDVLESNKMSSWLRNIANLIK